MDLLEKIISEIVLAEISARTGPRTGTFALNTETLNHIYSLALKYHEEFKKNPKMKPPKEIVTLDNPISGKPTRIPFYYIYKPNEKVTGWFEPYKNAGGGKIFLNVAYPVHESWFKTIINHELAHLFDKVVDGSAAWGATGAEYFLSPRERFAFFHQFAAGIQHYAMDVKKDIEAGKSSSILLGQTLKKKPQYLLRNMINRDLKLRDIIEYYVDDTEFMKKLMLVCFHAVQNYIIPAVQSQLQTQPHQVK